MDESYFRPTKYRRIVTLDIETVSTDANNPKGALDGLSCQIVCIGVLIDDGVRLTELAIAHEDEGKILTEFWASVQPEDVLVGHNLLEFDLVIIRQRSWVHGIRPSRSLDLRRYYTNDVKDTMCLWSNWGFRKGVRLDALASALGFGEKIGHGMDVADWWAIRDLRSISQYCLHDCWLTYQVFCRLNYLEPRTRQPRAEVQQIQEVTSARFQGPSAPRKRKRVSHDTPALPELRPE